MTSAFTLERFRFSGAYEAYDSFETGDGFGPFLVQRKKLREEILEEASPTKSYHISGAKGAGKTTLLELLGDDLLKKKKSVYCFWNATDIDLVRSDIDEVIARREEAYFLIDETHSNVNSSVFTSLLKNRAKHKITTIGAGVPAFQSKSGAFHRKIATSRLFLSEEDLAKEGVVDYFAADVGDPIKRNEIEKFITELRSYVGGHVYPLMRLSELLVQRIKNGGATSDETISYLNSAQFRTSKDFGDLRTRILPDLQDIDIRALFKAGDISLSPALAQLFKRGFCDMNGRVVSPLLLDLQLASLPSRGVPVALNRTLSRGVAGVQELFSFGTQAMSWDAYEDHGGPVEDALTFELLHVLGRLNTLGVMLFNPKLVTAGTSARRPDIYFNSNVHCYVECVLTKSNTEYYRRDVEKHVLRFFPNDHGSPHYQIQNADYAILHFQDWGNAPMQLQEEQCVNCFNERIFTFLMKTKKLFLGNTCIAG